MSTGNCKPCGGTGALGVHEVLDAFGRLADYEYEYCEACKGTGNVRTSSTERES